MLCPNCNVLNEEKNMFCVNCGTNFVRNQSGQTDVPPTIQMPSITPPPDYNTSNSVETSVLPNYQQSNPGFQQQYTPGASHIHQSKKSKTMFWAGGIFLLLLLLGGGGAAAYFLSQNSANAGALPEHFGLFSQNNDKNKLNEIKKQDFTNLLTAKEEFEKDDDLPVLPNKPNLILFAENNNIPLNDLKLVQIDSIKDDGSLKQLDFQAAPVEGKPEMKRIRVSESLSNGKYAFALFDGFMDDGKHKLWAFQIKNSGTSDNGDLAKITTLNLKPKEEKKDKPTTEEKSPTTTENAPPANAAIPSIPQPSGVRVATLTQGNVVMRSGPSQNTAKIGGFKRGQKVYVINYSDNYEYFNNLYSNYAYVQTESGKRGWVYAAFIK